MSHACSSDGDISPGLAHDSALWHTQMYRQPPHFLVCSRWEAARSSWSSL
jgi:hypothetical protein